MNKMLCGQRLCWENTAPIQDLGREILKNSHHPLIGKPSAWVSLSSKNGLFRGLVMDLGWMFGWIIVLIVIHYGLWLKVLLGRKSNIWGSRTCATVKNGNGNLFLLTYLSSLRKKLRQFQSKCMGVGETRWCGNLQEWRIHYKFSIQTCKPRWRECYAIQWAVDLEIGHFA